MARTGQSGAAAGESRPRGPLALSLAALLGVALFAAFVALGVWQVERRAWKLDLIARVEARVSADPVPAPGPAAWPYIDAARAEYRHVRLRGTYLFERTTFVGATTERGRGYWALTPLVTGRGFVVLVNRGFVPPDAREAVLSGPEGPVAITGLLRITEPGGGFLQDNVPSADRWYSRDVAAIGAAREIARPLAPYFVDAATGSGPERPPIGGLTVIDFRNSHLVYAITWFALALMVAAASVYVTYDEIRLRRHR